MAGQVYGIGVGPDRQRLRLKSGKEISRRASNISKRDIINPASKQQIDYPIEHGSLYS
jgi:hypothetical protein